MFVTHYAEKRSRGTDVHSFELELGVEHNGFLSAGRPSNNDMTQVCIVGDEDTDLRYELFSRETAREALSTYDIEEPFENSIAVETVSLGGAVSLVNDLDWYLVRFADDVLLQEPSVSVTEWLSRDLATAIRRGEIDPNETGEYLKVYGVVDDRLVEPMFLVRTGEEVPEYDIRDVSETIVVRVTETEFGGQ